MVEEWSIPIILMQDHGHDSAVLGEGFYLAKTFRFGARLDKKLSEQRNVYEIPEKRNEIFCSRLPKAGRSISSAKIPDLCILMPLLEIPFSEHIEKVVVLGDWPDF